MFTELVCCGQNSLDVCGMACLPRVRSMYENRYDVQLACQLSCIVSIDIAKAIDRPCNIRALIGMFFYLSLSYTNFDFIIHVQTCTWDQPLQIIV